MRGELIFVDKHLVESQQSFKDDSGFFIFKVNVLKRSDSRIDVVHRFGKGQNGKSVDEGGFKRKVIAGDDGIVGVQKDFEGVGFTQVTSVGKSFELNNLLGGQLVFADLFDVNQTNGSI